ncbi:MAG: LamG-like jellyroll fold domain-containing protein [Thermoguttaceae bacterium]
MKKILLVTCLFLLFPLSVFAQELSRSLLQTPILFAKRYNYQGLHIYDTFYQWRPGGGIYVLENPADPPEKHRIRAVIDANTKETLGEGIYFDPSLSYDAKKILFCFKGTPNGNSVIYEIGVDGTGLRQITNLDNNGNPYKGSGGGHHDVKPCYLPDDRIVFCSTRYSGLVPCANNGVTILHVMNNDGSEIHTISVNNVTEFDPTVMPDGRILFGRWEYIDKNALTIQSLWTVLPDGTNETALYANNMVFPEATLQAKPVPGSDYLIVSTFAPHNAPPRGTIAMIDTRKGKNDESAIINFETPDHPTFDRGDSCDPWALDENVVLYSGIPKEGTVGEVFGVTGTGRDVPFTAPRIGNDTPAGGRGNSALNALQLINRNGEKLLVLSDPQFDLHNPIPLVSRPRPRVIADTTDRSKITGNFFVHDVYEGMPDVPKGSLKWLRVVEETSRVSESPGGSWMNQTFSISAALAWSPKIYHGIIPVEEDGSVFFEAPAGRSLNFQLLDEDYRLVRSMRTFIQAAPGTTRSCTGCHEYKYGTSPAIAASKLLGKEPRQLHDEEWGSGYMDYASMIQPVLNERCVSCHGGEKGIEGGLDLTGGWTELFNISYENLTARREKQYTADLIQGICCMNGTAYWSCKIFDAYQHGSGNAPLADRLLDPDSPCRKLSGITEPERELLFTWMDSNGLYFGSWDYTQTGAFAREYNVAKNELITLMKNSKCAECHTDDNGNIRRFDDWINLEKPELSRILRAPLTDSNGNGTSENGYGLALCRDRKANQRFSRLGLMFQSGYEHAVRNLDEFPTQVWQNWDDSLKGTPVVTFESTSDPTYQKMLEIIKDARVRQLVNPRVDMPFSDEIGKGVTAGRYRQIIPQPLPENTPELIAVTDSDGVVRLHWERSCRTIGLIFEIHRSSEPNFEPNTKTLVGRTERFEFTDKNAPAGTAFYALIPVTDPAETCGTCKSGAVLDHSSTLSFGRDAEETVVPELRRIEDRCPLSMVEPLKGKPSFTKVEVPKPAAPAAPENLKALSDHGSVWIKWDEKRPGQYQYVVTVSESGKTSGSGNQDSPVMTSEPIYANSYIFGTPKDIEYTFEVYAIGRDGVKSDVVSVSAKPLPEQKEPVFEMEKEVDKGKLNGEAAFSNGVLNISKGGHLVFPTNPDFGVTKRFSVECEVKFDKFSTMPIIVSNGSWNQSGWFIQKLGNGFRFHFGGVDCDGGVPETGKWFKLLGTYDGKTLKFYVDGKLVAEKPANVNLAQWGGNFYVGQYSAGVSGDYQTIGEIKNLRIYKRVLVP